MIHFYGSRNSRGHKITVLVIVQCNPRGRHAVENRFTNDEISAAEAWRWGGENEGPASLRSGTVQMHTLEHAFFKECGLKKLATFKNKS